MQEEKDFFISYHQADYKWAEWIAYQLEAMGYCCTIRAWDFLPGSNLIWETHKALDQNKRILMVLSPDYLAHQSEWTTAFVHNRDALLPIRVHECNPSGLLAPIIYIDLVDLGADAALEALSTNIQRMRIKPSQSPKFPTLIPNFPGPSSIQIALPTNLPTKVAKNDTPHGFILQNTLQNSKQTINRIIWSPDGDMFALAYRNEVIQIWDENVKNIKYTFHGKNNYSIAWSPDGQTLASGDRYVLFLWDTVTGKRSTLDTPNKVNKCVAWSPNGKTLASGSNDNIIRLWNPTTKECLCNFTDHSKCVNSIAWSPDGRMLASGSDDNTIRLWNPATEQLIHTFIGHSDSINSIAWSPDGQTLASASSDNTIRLWDFEDRRLLATIEGHTKAIICIAFYCDGSLLASKSLDGTVRLWHCHTGKELARIDELPSSDGWYAGLTFHPTKSRLATLGEQDTVIRIWDLDIDFILKNIQLASSIQYTTAKVVLVGDKGVGKTSLGLVLTNHPYVPPESTHGRTVRILKSPEISTDNKIREILLWDLAGQKHYRLIHQLYMNEVALALIVFNKYSSINPLTDVKYWSNALKIAKNNVTNINISDNLKIPTKSFLVATHIDLEGKSFSHDRIGKLMHNLQIDDYFETSAKAGIGIIELVSAIKTAINWEILPTITSITLFQNIKDFIISLRKKERSELSSTRDLYQNFLIFQPEIIDNEELFAQFETCLTHMDSQGLIKKLNFSSHILLKPELLDYYASALIDAVLSYHESDGLGSISEENVMEGNFDIPLSNRLKDKGLEKILLIAMVAYLQHHEIILREPSDDGQYLVFPSLVTRELSDLANVGQKAITFHFNGPVSNIYARLAVRLSHSLSFKKKEMGKDAITFMYTSGVNTINNNEVNMNQHSRICGLFLRSFADGSGDLTLSFNKDVSDEARLLFINYVYAYLQSHAIVTTINQEDVFENSKNSLLEIQTLISDMNLAADSQRDHNIDIITTTFYKDQRMTDDIKENRRRSAEKIVKGEYDVFLSYNYEDEQHVRDIAKQLQDNGIAPFFGPRDLQPGLSWQSSLEHQIQKSASAAILIGQAGLGRWRRLELDTLLNEFTSRECPVIPVFLPNAPLDTEIPPFLKTITQVDFRKTEPEPFANLIWGITDMRPEKVYYPGVLIASLGDSPVVVSSMYDLLIQREKLSIDHITVLLPNGEDAQPAYQLIQNTFHNQCELHCEALDFDDANDERNARIFLQKLYHLLEHYQKRDEMVYLSLAGGRKSMAALMAWVVPFFPCIKKLYHVVDIDKEERSFPSVYEINALPSFKREQVMHPDLHQLALVDIPFKRGQQLDPELRSHLLSARPGEETEALISTQTILQSNKIPEVKVAKLVIDQYRQLYEHQKEKAQLVHNGLKEMSNIVMLRNHKGTDHYSYQPRRFPLITLNYFTGLQIPIRPIFYTLPYDIYDNPNEPVEQIIICALEQEGANGYRILEEVAKSPDFSPKHHSSIDVLPIVPSPANSILIVPLGKSPMIATQLYTLLTEQEQHTIHEIILIYPQNATEIVNAARLIRKAMKEEHNILCRLVGIPDLNDVTSTEACQTYQDCLEAEIADVQREHPEYKIDLALSGGRKGMTAMTIFAAQKKHIPYVYHTLISDEDLSDEIEDTTTVGSLNDPDLSPKERNDRLFLRAYKVEGPKPYAKFVLFRVPVFSATR